jgi:hypothetical protein
MKMDIDDAIAHAEAISICNKNKCGENHRQLAQWLRELKDLREVARQTRASILGWQPDEPTPMRHQMAIAIVRINNALKPNGPGELPASGGSVRPGG